MANRSNKIGLVAVFGLMVIAAWPTSHPFRAEDKQKTESADEAKERTAEALEQRVLEALEETLKEDNKGSTDALLDAMFKLLSHTLGRANNGGVAESCWSANPRPNWSQHDFPILLTASALPPGPSAARQLTRFAGDPPG